MEVYGTSLVELKETKQWMEMGSKATAHSRNHDPIHQDDLTFRLSENVEPQFTALRRFMATKTLRRVAPVLE